MIGGLPAGGFSASSSSSATAKGENTFHNDLGLKTGDGNRGFINNVNFGSGSVDAAGTLSTPKPWFLFAGAGLIGIALVLLLLRK